MNGSKTLRTVLILFFSLCSRSVSTGFAALDRSPDSLFTLPFDPSNSKIQITPSNRWGLFRESDSITIQTSDNSAIRIFDLDGNSVYVGNPTTRTLPRGHYFVECNGDRSQFAVLPNDYQGASFLGTEADNGTDGALTVRLSVINPSWVRTGYSQWAFVESQQGVRNWTAGDQVFAANSGRKIIAYAGDILPTWVNSANLLASYSQFVQALASRYSDQLACIEAWNEPWYNKFPNTTNTATFTSFYLQLLSQARQVVKAIDPSIDVIGPAWNGFQTDSLAMTNSLDLFDGWSWHDYGRGQYAPDQDYGSPIWVPRLQPKDLAFYFGDFATQTPLFVDELGLYGQSALGIMNTTTDPLYRSNLDWYRGMCRAIKTTVMYRACGAQVIIPHVLGLYAEPPNANIELYGWDKSATAASPRGPHPKTSAFLMSCYWLNNATLVDPRTLGSRVFLYAWHRSDNTSLLFAWTLEDQSVALTASMTVRDIFGRTKQISALSEEPVLFSSNSTDASALLSSVMAALAENINVPPVLSPIANQSVMKDNPLQFVISATDSDNDAITYSTDALPPGAFFDPTTKTFSWMPTAGQIGAYEVTFIATDARGLSVSATTTITVLGSPQDGLINHWKFDESSGTIASDSAGPNAGTLQNFGFSSTSGWVADINGNALSFDGVDDYVELDSNQISVSNNFTVTAWLYPRNASAPGEFISLCSWYVTSGMRFFVNNNSLLMQGQTTAGWQGATYASGIIVNNTWQHVAIVYDKSTIRVYLNGISQGSDEWGGDFVMTTAGQSRIGMDGAYSYNGLVDDVRIYNRTLSPTEIQTLVQDDSPLALSTIGNKSIPAGQTLAINCIATGGSGGSRTFSATPLLAGATMNATSGAFAWTPILSQVGTYGVTFAVSDGSANANQAVLITVTQTNAVPVLAPIGSSQVSAGQTLALAVSATDADGDALTYSASPLPSGVGFDAATGALSWTPQASQVGSYNVTFGVSDDKTNVSQTASITVITANTPPVLKPIKPKRVRAGRRVRIALKAKDRDRDALTYTIDPLPAGATFDPIRRRFEWIPIVEQVGQYNLTAGVTDGYAISSQPMSVTVY